MKEEKRYRSIHPHPSFITHEAKCGLYLTNDGIWANYDVKKVGSLFITPERVERNVIYFKSLKEFFSYIKSIAKDPEIEYDLVGNHATEVGYIHYSYITKYGTLIYSKGEWMDNQIMWKTKNLTCFLGEPNKWK